MKKKIAVTILVLFSLLLVACSDNDNVNNSTNDELQNKETVIESNIENTEKEEDKLMNIDTEYGSLNYPQHWQDELQTEKIMADEILTVSFMTKIDGKTYPLFKVLINDDEATTVGSLKDEKGVSRNVSIEAEEPDISDLSEASQNQIYAMQEDLNSLIDALD